MKKNLKFKKERQEYRFKSKIYGIFAFVLVLVVGGIMGLVVPRPKTSDIEKRDLAKFPAFSAGSFIDGSFFSGVSSWYADSFPLRDFWMSGNDRLKNLYGIKTTQIISTNKTADEIPTVSKPSDEATEPKTPANADESQEPGTENPPLEELTSAEDTTVETSTKERITEAASSAEPGTEAPAESTSEEMDKTEEPGTEALEESIPEETDKPAEEPVSETTALNTTAKSDGAGTTEAGGNEEHAAPQLPENPVADTAFIEQTQTGIYSVGDTAYGLYYFNQKAADTYVATVNRTASAVDGMSNVYCVLVPNSGFVYLDADTNNKLGCSNQQQAIDYYYASLDSNVHKVSVTDALLAHKDEYIYFRTDHHWTQLGAYYAYQQWASVKGVAANDISAYQTMEFPGFLGSYYSTSKNTAMEANPDTITAYVPLTVNQETYINVDNKTIESWPIVNDVSDYTASNKYACCFIGGDNPYTLISNPTITDGSSVMVVKESYANPFIPFLADHYQYVYVIDYRYYGGNAISLIYNNNIQDIIFLNNTEAISSVDVMDRMSGLFIAE